jgi:hypothetical protein
LNADGVAGERSIEIIAADGGESSGQRAERRIDDVGAGLDQFRQTNTHIVQQLPAGVFGLDADKEALAQGGFDLGFGQIVKALADIFEGCAGAWNAARYAGILHFQGRAGRTVDNGNAVSVKLRINDAAELYLLTGLILKEGRIARYRVHGADSGKFRLYRRNGTEQAKTKYGWRNEVRNISP